MAIEYKMDEFHQKKVIKPVQSIISEKFLLFTIMHVHKNETFWHTGSKKEILRFLSIHQMKYFWNIGSKNESLHFLSIHQTKYFWNTGSEKESLHFLWKRQTLCVPSSSGDPVQLMECHNPQNNSGTPPTPTPAPPPPPPPKNKHTHSHSTR